MSEIRTSDANKLASEGVLTHEIPLLEEISAPDEQLAPKGSDSKDFSTRFDVLCMLTKGSTKNIIFSLEIFEYMKKQNVNLDDPHFLHFPRVYELQARSEIGPHGFDVYRFTEDGQVMRQQRADEAKA